MVAKGYKKKNAFKKEGKGINPNLLTRVSLILLMFLIILGGVAGTVYGVKRWMKCCPYFFISTIDITGNDKVNTKRIIELSGIRKGDNIFSINLSKIRAEILKEPWVRDVTIERRFPDTVVIHIEEHHPFALTRIGKRIYLVDRYGIPFKPLEPKDAFSGPIITGIEAKGDIPAGPPSNGDGDLYQMIDTSKMRDALLIIRMSKRGVRALGYNNISQIDFPNSQEVVIYTADRAVPFHLDRTKIKKQFYRAEKILVQLYNSGQYAKVISVNVGYGKDMALAKVKGSVR